ncbi:MAG: FAD:protein FMN transferase [Ilumatobacteraceae bacterium]
MASGTQVTLVDPAPDAEMTIERRLQELERRWSRFLATSEVSRINVARDEWVPVTADTIALVESMQHAVRATGGSYDPTMLQEIIDAGYPTSVGDVSNVAITIDLPDRRRTVEDLVVDRDASSVFAPDGLALDPGGIGKGLAADLAVSEALRSGTAGALVSIGGDIAAAGSAPGADGWLVEVDDPLAAGGPIATLAVSAGGVATSSTVSRRWTHRGAVRHHVLDPATGHSSCTDLASVTVVATAGWAAEVQATAALLHGSDRAVDHLAASGLSGLAVALDGSVTATPDLDLTGARCAATAPLGEAS